MQGLLYLILAMMAGSVLTFGLGILALAQLSAMASQ